MHKIQHTMGWKQSWKWGYHFLSREDAQQDRVVLYVCRSEGFVHNTGQEQLIIHICGNKYPKNTDKPSPSLPQTRAHARTLTHVDPLPCSALLAENINNPSTFVPRAAFFKVLIKHCSSCNKHSILFEPKLFTEFSLSHNTKHL